jgi:hypothetical protein
MNDQIEHTIRRTRRYWNIDGLPEFGFGLICLLLGVYFLVQSTLESESLLYQVLNIVFILIVVGGSLISNRLVSYLKRKYTYPRTGYVTYRRPPRYRRLLLGLVAGLISSLLVVILYFTDMRYFWMPVLTAVIVAVVFAYVAYQGYAPRYYYLALFSLAFGAIAALAGLKDLLGLALYYGGMGLVQLASGAIVFRNFLAINRPADEDEL